MTRLSAGARAARAALVLVVAWLITAISGPAWAAGPAAGTEMRRLDSPATATATPGLLRISEVQGSGATVAITGPVMVEAIVTSLFERDDLPSGFFLQEEDADSDGDPATSEGIFVYCSTACPAALAVGDRVTVVGVAGEFGGASQINASAGSVTIRSSGNDLPAAATLTLPATGSTRAEGTFENLEGMIVTFPGKLVVSEYYWLARYGELVLTEGRRPYQFTHGHTPSTTVYAAFLADLATRRIILDDGNGDQNDAIFAPRGEDEAYPYPAGGLSNTNRFRGGDSIQGLTGVMHWGVRRMADSAGTRVVRLHLHRGQPAARCSRRGGWPPQGGRVQCPELLQHHR